ncbi:MAG TPA: DUF72 domain-containing protein [Geminicoccus sp.]|jgi:uncharacterized protein YecE (DUF72 family)|uniref:DUF72 domain-containing protein n=1 Tax=Geminicoccus sp. TaxID=2024832 RepID=UPI002E344003|nr:DUF72 domain-containing protein [Geminicoccus sp.]HEX2529457.1 DUF72 domain-containing protein [Geminicoccus sp.]
MVGTAGWTIPKPHASVFPADGSHLERYARLLPCVEINSSFYRPHRPSTYERWAASVPPGFRFAVKLPREISHTRRLVDAREPLDRFLAEAGALGDKLGLILVQLPPSLRFDHAPAASFFDLLRTRFGGNVVCEPRHPSWFTRPVDQMLHQFRIARVAADPAPVPAAASPGGWEGIVYRRLHGSPEIYYSPYPDDVLDRTAREMASAASESWCIFDNTALGWATRDALGLLGRLRRSPSPPPSAAG